MTCKECGEDKRIVAMGLCSSCYRRQHAKRYTAICKGCKEFKPIKAKGFCTNCYANFRRHGDPLWKRKKKGDTLCTYCGEKPMHAKGFCKTCYYRYLQTGSPGLKRRVLICKVEGCSFPVVFRGYCEEHKHKAPNKRTEMHKYLVNKFDITIDDYEKMYSEQNGVCAICGQPEVRRYNGNIINLAVDHCHETGKVRGLLCSMCNLSLGGFNDSLKLLKSAINYLDKHQT